MEDKTQFQINTGNGGGDPFTSTVDDYINGVMLLGQQVVVVVR